MPNYPMRQTGRYDWSEVVSAYMNDCQASGLSFTLSFKPSDDKAFDAIAAQLVAQAWGLA